MKVLVTGATGLVGKEIVSELHKKGHSVNYLTTRKNKLKSTENYKGFLWNPKKNEIDQACFEGVSGIINLAGSSIAKRWTPTQKRNILNSRLDSLKTLKKGLLKIEADSLRFLVCASGIGVYPNSQSTFYEEDCNDVDDSFLGEVVEQWEEEADSLKQRVAHLIKVRIGMVLSSKGGALPQIAKPIRMFVGAALGSGNQWQSWIHVNDLARLFVYLIENKLEGVYNGVAPNPVTNQKMTKELAKILKRPLWLPNIPEIVLKSMLGKMSYLLLSSQRVSSKKIEEKGFEFEFTNICKAFKYIYHGDEFIEDV